ncbi:MAG: helix-turn-helix domain-containing protein [Chloroflexi bacterium]|nr:helix-turn-helix domain-containing protein [Chloroflexota bacterium]
MESAVLKVNEAAKLLSVSNNYLYELINQNKVPGVIRVGRCIRISRKSLMTWIGDNEQGICT